MSKDKKFSIFTIALTGGLLFIVIAIIYIIDPFFNYHSPWLGMRAVVYNDRYQNPGIARNLEYDSIILGSSMTQNFRASWFDKAFNCSTVKLSVSAGRSKDYFLLMEQAFSSHEVKNVFFCIDVSHTLMTPANSIAFKIPGYLYNTKLTDDASYLLNKSVLFKSVPYAIKESANPGYKLDDAYTWDTGTEFSKEIAVAHYIKNTRVEPAEKRVPLDKYIETCANNLDFITPYIESNPDTDFYFFFPPYSVLFWENTQRNNDTEAILNMLEYTCERLLNYKNVKLYNFQNAIEIVTDLNNYSDYIHYNRETSQYVVNGLKEKKHLLTDKNYKDVLQDVYAFATEFEYDKILQ